MSGTGRSRLRTAAAAGLVLLAIGLAGCSSSSPKPPSATSGSNVQSENGSGVLTEYRQTVKTFPLALPKGSHFPSSPPKALLTGQSQVGVGVGPAYFFWLCSWEAKYLQADNSGNAADESTALTQIEKWPSTSFVKKYVEDPSNGWYTAVVAPAKLGDPTGVRNDMQGGDCPAQGVPIP